MKKLLIISLLLLPFLSIGQDGQIKEDSNVDYIKIVSFTPKTVVKDIEQEYTIKVKYNLVSKESGKMSVAPWTPDWQTFQIENVPELKKGEHEIEFKFKFTPTNHTHIQFSIIGEEKKDGTISILENANKEHCLDQFMIEYR